MVFEKRTAACSEDKDEVSRVAVWVVLVLLNNCSEPLTRLWQDKTQRLIF